MRATIISSLTVTLLAGLIMPASAQELRRFELELQQLPQPPQPPRPPRQPQIRRGDPQPRRDEPRGPQETERVSRTVRLSANGTLDFTNLAGDLVVTGGGGNEVTVEAIKRTSGPRSRLADVQIDVTEQGDRVEVRTRYLDNNRGANVSVDYTITVPQNAALFARSVAGDIRIANVRGELRVETLSGDIQAAGARRIGLLKTISGDITLPDAQTEGTISATTLSGNITYNGAVPRTGRYELTTNSGDIALSISTSGFIVEASTFNGDIRSDFAMTLGGNAAGGQRRNGPGQTIRGTFGDGGAVLMLRSFNGDISITRR